jgi:predicted ATPase/Tfp pilus assembly protein PilF
MTTNLSRLSTSFIGRQADLVSLSEKLLSSRCVVVLGAPGVGKSRLCRELALQSSESFCGVWALDCTEAMGVEGLCAVVSRALDVPLTSESTPQNTITQLGKALAARGDILLVLDNVERLAESVATAISRWMSLAPAARFLVTSRVRLQIEGEALFDLAPLSHEEATLLFIERAQAVRRGYSPTQSDQEELSALVPQLDGLPLAIELAAARMRVLSPAQIRKNLSKRFHLLTRGAGDGRQATLREAIDASWELLRPHEQSALAQCSVFRGGFSLEAAEAVLSLEGGFVVDLLEDLCDRSLLYRYEPSETPGEPRFALYASIREYAEEKLTNPEQTFAKHASYYLRSVEEWNQAIDGVDGRGARQRLFLEIENLLMVHRQASDAEESLRAVLALGPILYSRGPYGMYLPLLDHSLQLAANRHIDPLLKAKALHARGRTQQFLGKMKESLADYQEALALASHTNEQSFVAKVMNSLANHSYWQGKVSEARDGFMKTLALHQKLGDRRAEGVVYGSLAVLEQEQGNLGLAFKHLSDALRLHREVGDQASEGWTLGNFASFEQEQGRLTEARRHLERALALHRATGNRRSEAMHYANLAMIEQEQGDLTAARRDFQGALAIAREIGHRRFEGIFAGYLARCMEEAGNLSDARDYYELAIGVHREMGSKAYDALLSACLGGLLAKTGNVEAGLSMIDSAEEQLQKLNKTHWVMVAKLSRVLCERAIVDSAKSAEAAQLQANIQKTIEEARAEASRSADIRCALRIIEEQPTITKIKQPETEASITFGPNAIWFETPHTGRVNLQKRKSLRLIVKRLLEERDKTPGEAVSLDTLFSSGWPNERVHPEAGRSRLYMALCTLRNMGLRDVLVRQDSGYLLDPKVFVSLLE